MGTTGFPLVGDLTKATKKLVEKEKKESKPIVTKESRIKASKNWSQAWETYNSGTEVAKQGKHYDAIEKAQLSSEIALKSIFILFNKQVKKIHQLTQQFKSLPKEKFFAREEKIARTITIYDSILNAVRLSARYGDQDITNIPSREIFNLTDSTYFLGLASEICFFCQNIILQNKEETK